MRRGKTLDLDACNNARLRGEWGVLMYRLVALDYTPRQTQMVVLRHTPGERWRDWTVRKLWYFMKLRTKIVFWKKKIEFWNFGLSLSWKSGISKQNPGFREWGQNPGESRKKPGGWQVWHTKHMFWWDREKSRRSNQDTFHEYVI